LFEDKNIILDFRNELLRLAIGKSVFMKNLHVSRRSNPKIINSTKSEAQIPFAGPADYLQPSSSIADMSAIIIELVNKAGVTQHTIL
jgi:hypothetical protein